MYSFVPMAASVAAIGLGLFMLAARALDWFASPGVVSENPLSAVAFALAGAALWLSGADSRLTGETGALARLRTRLASARWICAAIAALTGLLQLAVRGGMFGAVSPSVGVNLFLTGLALLVLDVKTRHGERPAEFLAALVALVSMLTIVDHAYGINSLRGVGLLQPMPWDSALIFLLLALGMLFARTHGGLMAIMTSDTVGGVLARRLLPAAILVPAVLGWLRLSGARGGLYDLESSTALFAVCTMLFLAMLVWWNAKLLHRADAERMRAEAELQQAKDEAERANNTKSEFLSRTSHELRTPMNAILGFAQLLEMDKLDASQRDDVRHILKSGNHLLDLINQMLDIACIGDSHLNLAIEPVSVRDAWRNASELLRPLAAGRGVKIDDEALLRSRALVQADAQRLAQVLSNLLSNAIKFNHVGGSVVVGCEETGGRQVRISVRDTGLGIPADKMHRLFTLFDRLGAERTGTPGTGVGLTVSKRLIEAMGGAIEVSSTAGGGSTFSITLAAAAAEQAPASPVARPRVVAKAN
jgi:two-component system, sensor histidine kinase and response regulator